MALKEFHPDIIVMDGLMTINWLFLYNTYPVLSGRWKKPERGIRHTVIEIGEKMAKLTERMIPLLKPGLKICRTVDCVPFMSQSMRLDPSTDWFDWKTESPIMV